MFMLARSVIVSNNQNKHNTIKEHSLAYGVPYSYDHLDASGAYSPTGSGELVWLFRGVWHASPASENMLEDGKRLNLDDFSLAASSLYETRVGRIQGSRAFGGVFHALWKQAPTVWNDSINLSSGYLSGKTRYDELLIGTQEVSDLLDIHLEHPKKRLLTPTVARITHFVIRDCDIIIPTER